MGAARGPIDIGAAGSMAFSVETIAEMGRVILDSDEVDALILHGFGRLALVMSQAPELEELFLQQEKEVMRACARLTASTGKPVLIGSAILSSQSRAIHDLTQEGVLIFHDLEEIADVLSLKYVHQQSFPRG